MVALGARSGAELSAPRPRLAILAARALSGPRTLAPLAAMSLPSPPTAAHLPKSDSPSTSAPGSPFPSRPPSPSTGHRTAYAYPQTPDLASAYTPASSVRDSSAPASAATSRAASLSKDPLLKPKPRGRRGSIRAQGAQGVGEWLRRALKRGEGDAQALELEERGRSRRLSSGQAERAAAAAELDAEDRASATKIGGKKLKMSRERAQFVCAFAMIALVGPSPPSSLARRSAFSSRSARSCDRHERLGDGRQPRLDAGALQRLVRQDLDRLPRACSFSLLLLWNEELTQCTIVRRPTRRVTSSRRSRRRSFSTTLASRPPSSSRRQPCRSAASHSRSHHLSPSLRRCSSFSASAAASCVLPLLTGRAAAGLDLVPLARSTTPRSRPSSRTRRTASSCPGSTRASACVPLSRCPSSRSSS